MFIVNKLNMPTNKIVSPESLNDTETQEVQYLLSSFSTKKLALGKCFSTWLSSGKDIKTISKQKLKHAPEEANKS